jgi:hypothetical protein
MVRQLCDALPTFERMAPKSSRMRGGPRVVGGYDRRSPTAKLRVAHVQIPVPLFAVLLVACSHTGVVPMDKGTYMVAKKSPQVGFGPNSQLKADVYAEANEFCSKSGKTVETIKFEDSPAGFAKSPTASLQFRCV